VRYDARVSETADQTGVRDVVVAAATLPPGCWAVGVSGGADSVALLLLLHGRPGLALHVVHLDHETRAGASTDDARFVEDLCARLGLPCTVARRTDVEPDLPRLPANTSSRFRAARLALFRRVVRTHDLSGVVLAHHADDQAETILLRLLRGSGASGLTGMSPRATVGGLTICRPLLGVRHDDLRALLAARAQPWRDDPSNASDDYLRNRVRRLLVKRPALAGALLHLGAASRSLRDALRANVPETHAPELHPPDLLPLPAPLRRELARQWLTGAGVPPGRIEPSVVARLLEMLDDLATPARRHFPGRVVVVRRTGGVLSAQSVRPGD
jgi:tRNA(Ile)-lysidine synthase